MRGSHTIQNEIAAQKRAIRRLKREIFGIDKTYRSRYIRDFTSEYRTFSEIVPVDVVIDRAAAGDIVYFGDYHPLRASQDLVLELMRELTARGRKLVLALEMLYTHQQPFLDRWMKGTISEGEFLESIEYYSEWGFDWDSYRRIFSLAKDPFIPIFGIDEEPRDQLRFIRTRDRLIARRIGTIRRFFPGYLVLVVIGESHLASNHLPAEVRECCDDAVHDVVIVQNIEAIFWRLLTDGREDADAVGIDRRRYCIFNTSPILKYESYRDIIETWVNGGMEHQWSPVFHGMVEDILLFAFGGKDVVRITVGEGIRGTIDDVFPEVHVRKTYRAFAVLLRSMGMIRLGSFAYIEYIKLFGITYIPAINAFCMMKFEPGPSLREAARFVVWAMRDQIGKPRRKEAAREDRFYSFVLEEALVYFCAKIVNPKQDCLESDAVLGTIDSRGVVRRALPHLSMRDTRKVVRMVKYHFRRDRSTGKTFRITKGIKAILRLGIVRRWFIVRTLGHTLGEAIHQAYHAGRMSRDEIIDLFRDRLEAPGAACRRYRALVRRVSPYRGFAGSYRSEIRNHR